MSSIDNVKNYKYSIFSKKNIEIKNLKNGEKKRPRTLIYVYYFFDTVKETAVYSHFILFLSHRT